MHTVVHLVPYDGIGGVEVAARTMADVDVEFKFNVEYLLDGFEARAVRWRKFNPFIYLIRGICYAGDKCDVLIVSLWRCYIVGIIAKFLRPNLRLVVFLHSSKSIHFVDEFSCRLAIWCADEVWADSQTVLKARVPQRARVSTRVISFVPSRLEPLSAGAVTPSFIFWGRLDPIKNVKRAIEIFIEVRRQVGGGRFLIVGPDSGALKDLKLYCSLIGAGSDIVFYGPGSQAEIAALASDASFFIQSSLQEGMGLSVIEAMQLGLVPVVTPVGEIGVYCKNRFNAIVIDSNEQAICDLVKVIGSNDTYQSIRERAISRWREVPSYRSSIISACRALLRNK